MPIKGEQQGYTYKALINGEWQEITIQESPLELAELFEQDEEWTRVRTGRWIEREEWFEGEPKPRKTMGCSECGHSMYSKHDTLSYCPNCGAKNG